jgi:hypothetical protein
MYKANYGNNKRTKCNSDAHNYRREALGRCRATRKLRLLVKWRLSSEDEINQQTRNLLLTVSQWTRSTVCNILQFKQVILITGLFSIFKLLTNCFKCPLLLCVTALACGCAQVCPSVASSARDRSVICRWSQKLHVPPHNTSRTEFWIFTEIWRGDCCKPLPVMPWARVITSPPVMKPMTSLPYAPQTAHLPYRASSSSR